MSCNLSDLATPGPLQEWVLSMIRAEDLEEKTCTDMWHVMCIPDQRTMLECSTMTVQMTEPGLSISLQTVRAASTGGASCSRRNTWGERSVRELWIVLHSQPRKMSRRRTHRSPPSCLSYNLQSLCQWDFCFHVWMFTLQSSSYKTFQQRFCSTN